MFIVLTHFGRRQINPLGVGRVTDYDLTVTMSKKLIEKY